MPRYIYNYGTYKRNKEKTTNKSITIEDPVHLTYRIHRTLEMATNMRRNARELMEQGIKDLLDLHQDLFSLNHFNFTTTESRIAGINKDNQGNYTIHYLEHPKNPDPQPLIDIFGNETVTFEDLEDIIEEIFNQLRLQ